LNEYSELTEKEANMTGDAKINMGLIFDEMLFTTHNARGRYIGTITARRPQWLKDHPGDWSSLDSISTSVSSPQADSGISEWAPNSPPAPQNNAEGLGAIPSTERSSEGPPYVESLPVTNEAPTDPNLTDKAEVQIGSRTYISAARLAEMLGISERTLSRWCADGRGPPHLRLQGNYFDRDKIGEWAASRDINSRQV
jgi:hypothetical protein